MEAVANGHNVYFITVPELLDELARDVQENRLGEHLVKLRVPTLLILDEMGYLPLDPRIVLGRIPTKKGTSAEMTPRPSLPSRVGRLKSRAKG